MDFVNLFGLLGTIYDAFTSSSAAAANYSLLGQMAELDAKQLQVDLEAEKVAAANEEIRRRDELAKVISAQTAQFGASGISGTSGSFQAIQNQDYSKFQSQQNTASLLSRIRQRGIEGNIAAKKELSTSYHRASGYESGMSLLKAAIAGAPKVAGVFK